MALGPVLELPHDLATCIYDVLFDQGIQVESLNEDLRFRGRGGHITGHVRRRKDSVLLWLTCHDTRAFNPFVWFFDYSLSKKVARALKRRGAKQVKWSEFNKANKGK